MSEIKIEQIDDDGFLLGDNEQTQAENALLREIKGDTSTIINLMKGTQRLQREALKATQAVIKPKGNQSSNVRPSVNLVHPNRQSSGNQTQRVNLNHPNRSSANTSTVQANNTARPRIQQNQQGGTNSAQPPERTSTLNRQRDANGRFVGADNQASDSTQGYGNRDSRGRFVGGNGQGAAERAVSSRLTDSLKDLNNNLTINADTDRIDPMIDAMKEVGDIAKVGIDAGKKALSLSNTLIAKPAMALGRGIKGLFKPKTDAINSPVAWYKRIWRTLERGNRQDQTQHAQEQRRLDELVRGQGQRGSADSGLLAMLGLGLVGLLAGLKTSIPKLSDIVPDFLTKQDNKSPVPVYRAPTLAQRVQAYPPTRTQAYWERIKASPVGNAAKWLSETRVGQATSGFLKKLPLISSMLTAGAGGINAINIANDNTLTEAEKQRKQSENTGSIIGAIGGGLGGAAAGAMAGAVGGPIGIVVGSIVGSWLGTKGGQIVGEKVGGWVDDLRNADIAGRMTNAWNGFIAPLSPFFTNIGNYITSLYQSAITKTTNAIDSIVKSTQATWNDVISRVSTSFEWFDGVTDALNQWITNKTGIDIKDNLSRSKSWISEQANSGSQFLSDVGQSVKNTPLVQSAIGFWDGLTGETSQEKQAREHNFNAANYQQYKTVLEGAYSKQGFSNTQAQAFLKAQVQAESEFNPNAVSKKGAFGLTQFMPATAKQYGVMRGNTKEAINSQAIGQAKYMSVLLKRYGGDWDKALAAYNTGEGNLDKRLAIAKEKGVDWRTFLPKETKDYLVKIKRNALNYGALTVAQQAQVVTHKPIVAKTPTSPIPTAKATSVPTPSINASQVPVVKAEQQPMRLNTQQQTIKVSIAKPLVGQNMSDRGIAHIVTGGIGELAV